ncbi:MAG: hypothetical protein LIO97_11645 [Tannerellaceae bacterium]|nr:hypothetical protein [Tannerellaceae bacterium]
MRRNKLCKMLALWLLLTAPINLMAQKLTLADPFGEGAVLQQNSVINIWGTAAPYKEVTGEIQGKQFKTKSDKSGRWETTLSELKSGGPYQLNVSSATTQLIRNEIYVGEVWIAAGQSNMAWTLEQSYQGKSISKMQRTPIFAF